MEGNGIDGIGDRIRTIVEDAVDSQNFRELNQNIVNAVNQGTEYVQNIVKSVAEPWMNGGQSKTTKVAPKKRLFIKERGLNVAGMVAVIFGIVLAIIFGIMLASGIVVMSVAATPAAVITGRVLTIVASVFVVIAIVCLAYGGKRIQRVGHFRKYIAWLKDKTYGNLSELAVQTQIGFRTVLKDVQWMIQKRWFLEGHLDDEKQCLMLTDEMYQEYCQIKAQKQQIQEKEQQQRQKDAAFGASNPKVQKVLSDGAVMLQNLHHYNDFIPGVEISAKISRMETLTGRIFERIRQHPEQVDEIEKLMKYYLPTTMKLLHAYTELDAQNIAGENIESSKQEIERTLDTLNVAFEKLLDGLFQDTAWDVSSDISVLNTMLAQEGLKDDGSNFRK